MTELRYGGSQAAEAIAWQRAIVKFAPAYAKSARGGVLAADGWIGDDDAAVAREYRRRRNVKPAVVVPAGVVVTHEEYGALVKGSPAAPAPVRKRHLAICYRGTGGVVGADYVSRVSQQAADLYEEVNPEWPASMGGLPPGAPGSPSMNKAVQIGLNSGRAAIRSGRTFALFGYSAGAIVASKLRGELEPGGQLAEFKRNYVCGLTLGNPSRSFGHTYYMGPIPNGQGISTYLMPAAQATWDWCDLAHPEDMYTNVPPGDVWDIMSSVYAFVTDAEMSDFLGTATRMLPMILKVAQEAGIGLPFIGGALGSLGNPVALIGLMLPMFISALPGLIGQQGGLTGPAAAAQAAVIAMKFLMAGTGPHIRYEFNETYAGSGQTYLQLGIQHVRDWGSRVPAR